MKFSKLDFEIAFFSNFEGVLHRLGHFAEKRGHFARRAQIELLRDVAEAFSIGQIGLSADANEAIVGVRVIPLDVMHVVGRDQLQAELLRPWNQVTVDFCLLGKTVILKFEVKILRTERVLEPIDRVARSLQVVFLDEFGNFARQATRQGNQACVVTGQKLFVDARLIIIALEVRVGNKLDQVFVACFIFGEEDKMMVNVATAAAGRFLFQAAAGSDVDFAAHNGLDPLVARGLVKVDRTIKDPVIGEGDGGKFQFVRLVHQLVEAAGAVEQRVLAVQMKMDEL